MHIYIHIYAAHMVDCCQHGAQDNCCHVGNTIAGVTPGAPIVMTLNACKQQSLWHTCYHAAHLQHTNSKGKKLGNVRCQGLLNWLQHVMQGM